MDELVGIQLWQIFDTKFEVDHAKCLELLLKAKANPNTDLSSYTPSRPYILFHALQSIAHVDLLIKFKTDPNLTNKEGLTPICKIVDKQFKINDTHSNTVDLETAQLDTIEILIKKGKAKLLYCCKINPVLQAVKRRKYQIAKWLAMEGGDVNWRSPNQPSVIQMAVDQQEVELLKEILKWPKLDPIDYDYYDEQGKNIFHRLAMFKNLDLFLPILRSHLFNPALVFPHLNSPNANQQNDLSSLPLLECCPSIDLAILFIQAGATLHQVPFSLCYSLFVPDNLRYLEFLVKQGGLQIDDSDENGQTSLMRAAANKDTKTMQFLLRMGADPDARFIEDEEQRLGMTLLHEACLKGRVEQAKLLLGYGANFNLKCGRGRTALDFLKVNHEEKSGRRREELKKLLFKYTVKSAIIHKQ